MKSAPLAWGCRDAGRQWEFSFIYSLIYLFVFAWIFKFRKVQLGHHHFRTKLQVGVLWNMHLRRVLATRAPPDI
jgi:hypothetical protein